MTLAFDDVAEELYGLLPAEFTSTRDARAKEARRSGDVALAGALKQLKRPTSSAWLVNLLVRRRPEQVEELLALGAAMREAQDQLAGDRLRQLSQQRRQLVSALTQAARELAGDLRQTVGGEADREVEATLEAALADAAAGEAVRSGRLTSGLKPSALGSADLILAVATAPGEGGSPGQPAKVSKPPAESTKRPAAGDKQSAGDRARAQREAAERSLAEAEAVADGARAELAEQAHRLTQAQEERHDGRQAVHELEARLEEARAEEAAAATRVREAERAHEVAARAVRAAERRAAQARQTLGRLGG